MTNRKKIKGKIIIISSPSGGGKSTICRELLRRNKKDNWKFSVSVTTRKKRENEADGREYWFVDHAGFAGRRKAGEFAEWCRVHRYFYGTPRLPLIETLYGGGVILLDIDVKGARKLKGIFPSAATIFILPPGKKELLRRLKRRGTEDDKSLQIRRRRAVYEMKLYKRFEYTVINRQLDVAVREVEMIIKSLHCRHDNLDLEQIGRIVG
jgi:guanylate kinase